MRIYIAELNQWFNSLKTTSAGLEINCSPVHGLIHEGTPSKTEKFSLLFIKGNGPGKQQVANQQIPVYIYFWMIRISSLHGA